MKDVLIVGTGIAGCALSWKYHFEGKSVVLLGDRLKGSSAVAAGVYNPTILKRFTAVWKAQELLDDMLPFYQKIERITNSTLIHSSPILRRFHDEREIKTWQKKALKPELVNFMNPNVVTIEIAGINAPYGYGKVPDTGWLDTISFMNVTCDYFDKHHTLVEEQLDNQLLAINIDSISYKDIVASHIIFAEGFKMLQNPLFNHLPLQGNKGEVLTIKVPGLTLNHTIKSSVFIMPYKDDLFWVGATYNRDELSDQPTDEAFGFLTSRLERFLTLPYEVIDHNYGIRPTTMDRRPFVGVHPDRKNVYVFNGMGSRAVLITPWAASQLFNNIYQQQELHPEINIARFNKV